MRRNIKQKTTSLYVYDNEDAIANWTMDIINL